ncbi:trimeric intracellular cation channel family protein [Saccharopolyspora indica]|uniref:trimeric intracellular cation channel family protein n=1 Tax=Saccharopolyspora indica TaxID=1229659 RepID=UPI002FDC3B47
MLLVVLDMVGIVAFALAGAVDAVRARLDFFGTVVVAALTAIGGGIIRDVLLGVHPPVGIHTARYLLACAATALIVFLWYPRAARLKLSVQFADAIGLALFAITGATRAMEHGTPIYTAALIGMINGVGGGIIRDVLLVRIPMVLRQEIYALPALGGAALLAAGMQLELPQEFLVPTVAVIIVAVRMLAVLRNWNLPAGRLLSKAPEEPEIPLQPLNAAEQTQLLRPDLGPWNQRTVRIVAPRVQQPAFRPGPPNTARPHAGPPPSRT